MRFFFFNDTATTEIYTLSLHDALPISAAGRVQGPGAGAQDLPVRAVRRPAAAGDDRDGAGLPPGAADRRRADDRARDRKSTRLNSSHANISYAVFCLKKKKKKRKSHTI